MKYMNNAVHCNAIDTIKMFCIITPVTQSFRNHSVILIYFFYKNKNCIIIIMKLKTAEYNFSRFIFK